jgi:hypothetical protein
MRYLHLYRWAASARSMRESCGSARNVMQFDNPKDRFWIKSIERKIQWTDCAMWRQRESFSNLEKCDWIQRSIGEFSDQGEELPFQHRASRFVHGCSRNGKRRIETRSIYWIMKIFGIWDPSGFVGTDLARKTVITLCGSTIPRAKQFVADPTQIWTIAIAQGGPSNWLHEIYWPKGISDVLGAAISSRTNNLKRTR